ncbi:syntaxin-8-like [Haliotis rufescens]|uniref:syntaxin-8-like n=1 Tax=Haliotis rufescens TaxID=6454 RepID=UPI001EB00CA3|nr:syntaxin-8-like [Haliotis rufescens]
MAGDSWLSDYDVCARLGQEIMEKINERNKHNRTSSAYTKLSAQIRVSMKQFSGDLGKLRQNLMRASSSYHITQREVERRQMQLDGLTTKEKQMEQAFRNETGETRQSLLGNRGTDTFASSDPWGMNEDPDNFRGVANNEIQAQQQDIIREQDQGLEALSSVIARQKMMAVDIGNEVDNQNELIDDITDHVDRTGERLVKETSHIKIVDRKSNTCGYWVAIVLLFIAIIVIVAVPYNKKP